MPDKTRQSDRSSDHSTMKDWDRSRKDQTSQVSNDDDRSRSDSDRSR